MDYYKAIAHIYRQIRGMYFEKKYPEIKNPYASVNINNERNKTLIKNFLNKLNDKYGIESIGYNFLIDYLSYQFCCYIDSDKITKIQLSWILGEKAWGRWLNKKVNYQYWYKKNFTLQNINIEHIEKIIKGDQEVTRDLVEYQDSIRKVYKNSTNGFILCMFYDIFFDKKSNECSTCSFQETCKKMKNGKITN